MNLETVVLNTVGTADGISINRSGKEQNSGDFLVLINQLLGNDNPEGFIGTRKKELPLEVLEQASAMLNQNPVLLNSLTESDGVEDLIVALSIESHKINPLTYNINLQNIDKEVSTLIEDAKTSDGTIKADVTQLLNNSGLTSEKSDKVIESDKVLESDKILETDKVLKSNKVLETDMVLKSDEVLEYGKVLENDILMESGSKTIVNEKQETIIENGTLKPDLRVQANNISEDNSYNVINGLNNSNTNENIQMTIQNPRHIHQTENTTEITKSPVLSDENEVKENSVVNQSQEFEQIKNDFLVRTSSKSSKIDFNKIALDQSDKDAEILLVANKDKLSEASKEFKSVMKYEMSQEESISLDVHEFKSLEQWDNGFVHATDKKVYKHEKNEQVANDVKSNIQETETNDMTLQTYEKTGHFREVKAYQVDEKTRHQKDLKPSQNFVAKENLSKINSDTLFFENYNVPKMKDTPINYFQRQSDNSHMTFNTENKSSSSLPQINGIENIVNTNVEISTVETEHEGFTVIENSYQGRNNFHTEVSELNGAKENIEAPASVNHEDKEIEFNIESRFYHSINSVKKALRSDESKFEEVVINIDELQKQVNNTVFRSPQRMINSEKEQYVKFDIQNQVLDNLSAQLKTGLKEEFTIQLNPEGLGKITVKFVKDSEKIILNMTTTNETTAKLLSERLEDLQSSLRLHNAEINNIAVQKPENASEYMAHNNSHQSFNSGQNFNSNSNNYFSNSNRESHYHYSNFISDNNELGTEQNIEVIPDKKISSILNMYI